MTWASARRAFDALAAHASDPERPDAVWPWSVRDDGGRGPHLVLTLPRPLRGVVGVSPRVWRLQLGTEGSRRPDRVRIFAIVRMPPEKVIAELVAALEGETRRLARDRRAVLLREAIGRLALEVAHAAGERRRAALVGQTLGDAALDEMEPVAARHWYATALDDARGAGAPELVRVLGRKLATAERTEQPL